MVLSRGKLDTCVIIFNYQQFLDSHIQNESKLPTSSGIIPAIGLPQPAYNIA